MDKKTEDKKYWIGELSYESDITTLNNFILIDCNTKKEAEKILNNYASDFMDGLDSDDSEEGRYSFCGGNLIICTSLSDTKMTITEYVESHIQIL